MYFLLINLLIIPLCFSDSNLTESCGKCSPCWNVVGTNYGVCSRSNYTRQLFTGVQPICIDTFILLIIFFLSVTILLPTGIRFIYRWIQRPNDDDDDTRYVIDGLMYY